MSLTVEELDDDSPVHPGEHHTHGPTNRTYITIFLILLAITVLEVSTYFWDKWFGRTDTSVVAYPLLLVLMVIKFGLIASVFMHLRFDSKMLSRIFYFGIVIAVVVYVAAMSTMNIFTDHGNSWFNDPPPQVTTTTTIAPAGG